MSISVFGGQSIVLNGTVSNGSFPIHSKALPWRVELYLHDWADTIPSSHVAIAHGVGFQADIFNLSGRLIFQAFSWWDGNGSVCQIELKTVSPKAFYLRFQRDPAMKTSYCEMWDMNGVRIHSSSHTYTFDYIYNFEGIEVGDNVSAAPRSMGFFRIHSSIVPLNSRPPVTYDPDNVLLWWKFDGDLRDSSGNGYNGVVSGGRVGYVSTPGQGSVAFPKTYGAPTWNTWVSLRAGFPQRLDASASYSQGDSSASVTYLWQLVSGPTNVVWDDPASASPTVRGLIFGTYVFRLTVKDARGTTGTADLTVGAVATDSNGVIVQANPAADLLFGPMIAFGKNPWAYADERALRATTLRTAVYDATGLASPSWLAPRAGTVTYDLGPRSTTLDAPITASAMSISVSDVTQFDLTTFPTLVLIGNIPFEEIHICSASGNTLEVCYDGRGWRIGAGYHLPAKAWSGGAKVWQLKMTGNDTEFLGDFCPAGPGWSGTISYQAGTVRVTTGSASVAGEGTSWSNLNAGGRAIRIEGTHGGGTPFVFHAYVSSVSGDTSLVMNRPWPADADSGTFSYALINADTRNITPHYDRSDGTDGQIYFITSGCESNTELYRYFWWDALSGSQIAKQYSYMDGFGYVGDVGPNFYDEGLAHYALYLRSGWKPALDAFRKIEGQDGTNNPGWLWYPELAQGDAGGIPRRMSVTGAVVAAVLDGKTSNWSGLRTLANTGGTYAVGQDCQADVRENAYQQSWLAMAALFDPDPVQRARWITQVGAGYVRDNNCKQNDNSWSNGAYWNFNTPPLTATNGSATLTGTGISASICNHVATVTNVSVTNGSDVVTGTGFVAGGKIAINGTVNGVSKYLSFNFILDSSSQIHLSGMYPGATATGLTAYIDGDDLGLAFGTGFTDPQLAKNWSCTSLDSGHLRLDRPWDGPTGIVYGARFNLAGNGMQPFILGIKTLQMSLASQVASSPLNTNYGVLANAAANWIKNNGYDPATGGLYYGRNFDMCEPVLEASSQPGKFLWRNPECTYSPSTGVSGTDGVARALNGEAQNALRVLYQSAPTDDNLTFGDQFYGSIWGAPGFTQTGFYSDGTTASNLTDNDLASYKWTGFFFGTGMAHQWPAVRVGGVQNPDIISLSVAVDLDTTPQAGEARITVTQPSSAQTVYHCASSPCSISLDRRQGAHWVSVDYVLNSGEVLSSAAPYLLDAP